MGNPFLEQTAVVAVEPGRYEATVDEAWNLRPLPQGGVVSALALRAMTDALGDPSQQLRTLHTAFIAQVTHGPVAIQAELLRRGRSMSHLRAEVANVGAARGHVTTAVFGSTREGFEFTGLEPPDHVPPPAECLSFRDPAYAEALPFTLLPFWARLVEGRTAVGHAPWDEYIPGRAERAIWYRFDEPPFLDDGTIDPLALIVLADTMPGAVHEGIGPTERLWFAPSVDLTVHLFGECRSPWVLGHNHARHAGDGYASADMALWDCGPQGSSAPRLVAYATQVFVFSFLEGLV